MAIRYFFCESFPFAIGYGLIIFGATIGPAWLRRPLSWPGLCFVGVIGYSIYLLHMPLLCMFLRIPWIANHSLHSRLLALCVAAGAVTIAASTIFFVLVERPAMNAAKRFGRPRESWERPPASPL